MIAVENPRRGSPFVPNALSEEEKAVRAVPAAEVTIDRLHTWPLGIGPLLDSFGGPFTKDASKFRRAEAMMDVVVTAGGTKT